MKVLTFYIHSSSIVKAERVICMKDFMVGGRNFVSTNRSGTFYYS